jgi:hypothetical protein
MRLQPLHDRIIAERLKEEHFHLFRAFQTNDVSTSNQEIECRPLLFFLIFTGVAFINGYSSFYRDLRNITASSFSKNQSSSINTLPSTPRTRNASAISCSLGRMPDPFRDE